MWFKTISANIKTECIPYHTKVISQLYFEFHLQLKPNRTEKPNCPLLKRLCLSVCVFFFLNHYRKMIPITICHSIHFACREILQIASLHFTGSHIFLVLLIVVFLSMCIYTLSMQNQTKKIRISTKTIYLVTATDHCQPIHLISLPLPLNAKHYVVSYSSEISCILFYINFNQLLLDY